MDKVTHLASLRAQGVANQFAAERLVEEHGGACDRVQLRRQRLGRGADRAVRAGLLIRQGARYVLNRALA